ncbi:MAG: hypothetical protein JXB13_15560 [Phycisphaerae bacterium]|nr:hypothetical protein [Phycisphaerae bacterium]
MSDLAWKPNWPETRRHFIDWWNHRGLVVAAGTLPCTSPHDTVPEPPEAGPVESYENGSARARRNHYKLSRRQYPGDALPISNTNIGPGSLAIFLGSEPGFSPETVWFEPCIHDVESPELLPPLTFDPHCHWWLVTEVTCRACAELAAGRYLVGCPDLVENIDIIAALRDPQTLMMDMITRPQWVEQKVWEINEAFFKAYRRIYDIIKLPDGSAAWHAFGLWGPGKTAKVQCDGSAMFSPDMFKQFVVPALTEQCEWLDNSMYHLDGTQAIDKLDHLLEIEPLDAIEWTPQAGIEGGGDPRWFNLYRRILDAGKSVQAVGVKAAELEPLLDTLGAEGVYVIACASDENDTEHMLTLAESFRS